MKIEIESASETIPSLVTKSVVSDITAALDSIRTVDKEFIVNDTLWFWKNPKGKIKPSVVNSAKFITTQFQKYLQDLGWTKEPEVDGQTFDGMNLIFDRATIFNLSEENYLPLLLQLRESGVKDYGLVATELFRDYVNGSRPFLPTAVDGHKSSFNAETIHYGFRIGLEFETGNIASSFRAISKLQGLYESNQIDIGVFITSKSKADGAAKIWPVSNRNGSFEELLQRRYQAQRLYPHIDISFRPDGYDKVAPYFSETSTYEMRSTNEIVSQNGKSYSICISADGVQKLRPLV
jgi:hypothetical protein